MHLQPQSLFAEVNGIRLHYLHYASEKPTLVLLHGLTSNAHAFAGLVSHGLAENFNLIIPDLRGRGLSEKTAFNYSMKAHADDVLGLIEHLNIDQFFLGGHSFGGFLSVFITSQYSQKINRLILLDAAVQMNPETPNMLSKTLGRLDVHFETLTQFFEHIQASPFLNIWDKDLEEYYRADVEVREDGRAEPRANLAQISQAMLGLAEIEWTTEFSKINIPTLLVHGLGAYAMGMPLLLDEGVDETKTLIPHLEVVEVEGNHITMLYQNSAQAIVSAISEFVGR